MLCEDGSNGMHAVPAVSLAESLALKSSRAPFRVAAPHSNLNNLYEKRVAHTECVVEGVSGIVCALISVHRLFRMKPEIYHFLWHTNSVMSSN